MNTTIPAASPTARVRALLGSQTGLLMLNGILMNLVGVAFWKLVTVYYTQEQVGAYQTFVAATFIAQTLGGFGLAYGVNIFMPTDRKQAIPFTNAVLTLYLLGLLLAGLAYALVAPWFGWSLQSPIWFFVLYVLVVGFFNFIDHFFGLLNAAWAVVTDNLVSNIVRIALIAFLVGLGAFGPMWTNVIGMGVSLIVSFIFLLPKVLPGYRPRATVDWPLWKQVTPLSVAQAASGWFWSLPPQLITLVAAGLYGNAVIATYQTAWLYAATLQIIASAFAVRIVVMLRETPPEHAWRGTAKILTGTALTTTLAVIAAFVAAPFILEIFGREYRTAALEFIPALLVGVLPFSIQTVLIHGARQRQQHALVWTASIGAPLVTLIALYVLRPLGPASSGWAWTMGQIAVTVVLLGAFLLEERGKRKEKSM